MRIPAAAYNGFFRIAGGCRSGRNHLFVLLFRDIEQVEAVVRYRSDAVVFHGDRTGQGVVVPFQLVAHHGRPHEGASQSGSGHRKGLMDLTGVLHQLLASDGRGHDGAIRSDNANNLIRHRNIPPINGESEPTEVGSPDLNVD